MKYNNVTLNVTCNVTSDVTLTDTEMTVLAVLKENPNISRAEIAENAAEPDRGRMLPFTSAGERNLALK